MMNYEFSVTPEIKAEFLKKYAHLEGEDNQQISVVIKYYTFDPDKAFEKHPKRMEKSGFKVIYYNGNPVQVEKIGIEEAKTMAKCSKLKFGDF